MPTETAIIRRGLARLYRVMRPGYATIHLAECGVLDRSRAHPWPWADDQPQEMIYCYSWNRSCKRCGGGLARGEN